MTFDVYTHLYGSTVAPVLNYGAGLWGTCSYSSVNTIQNKACRFFLGVGAKAANTATRGDMGWQPQLHYQYIEVMRLYHRLETLPNSRLNSKIHHHCKTQKSPSAWIKKVQKLFKRLKYDNSDTNCTSKLYVHRFKDFLATIDQEKWYHELFNDNGCINGNKLRTFRLYKDRMATESYVTSTISRGERSVLAKLRSGTLPLEIETGRFKKVPLSDRCCNLCKSGIEDEVHFLIDCDFYQDLRYNMFQYMAMKYEQFAQSPSLVKFILIMLCPNVNLIANTVFKMFTRRKTYI